MASASTPWLLRLVQVALRSDPPRGLDTLVQVIAEATDSAAAVLWEAATDETGSTVPTVLAMWSHRAGCAMEASCTPDPVTLAAFAGQTLVIAQPKSVAAGSPDGAMPRVALPFVYLDGVDGVLTLLRADMLTVGEVEVASDLLTVLPELCSSLRDRQTLALVKLCEDLLRKAEIESSSEPLRRDRLGEYLDDVCKAIGDSLRCRDVSIYLQDPGEAAESVPLIATSSDTPAAIRGVQRSKGLTGWPIEHGAPGVALPPAGSAPGPSLACDRTQMVAPLTSGERVLGEMRCGGTHGPPFHFTMSDVSLLTPVASQIAQYWSSWLQRRIISAEIDSWRRFAASVTGFNELMADELRRKSPSDEHVYEAALAVIQEVVPGCVGAAVHQVRPQEKRGPAIALVQTSGPARNNSVQPSGTQLVRKVHASGRQAVVTDLDAISSEGLDQDTRWMIGTPIGVGTKTYGVLDAYGRAPEPPANSAQVCEIVGDQLGLYQHLQETLDRLRETRQRLQATMRGQAEALEDLEHQLVSPLLAATSRTERVLQSGRFDSRTEAQLRAVRGLCRKASRVAMSAGVFAALSTGRPPIPKLELHGADDFVRLLIAAADDAQMLSDARRHIRFDVNRESVRSLGRQLVSVDRTFIEQCIGNLLDNAVKYSYENTWVDISGSVGRHEFIIAVTNTGLPLKTADLDHLLERNWRGDLARSATGEGSGLGLWIVDNLMRSMQAKVEIIPDENQTTARLTIPLIDSRNQRRN